MIYQLQNYYFDKINKLFPEAKIKKDSFKVEKTKHQEFGDYALNAAMVLTKKLKMSPMEIANFILAHIKLPSYIEKAEIAKPGFINLFLRESFLYKNLYEIYSKKENYGVTKIDNPEKILIEFVSANPTGPLNVVSARAAAVGNTLVNIFNFCGYDCKSEFYVNDAGNQVNILAKSVYLRYCQLYDETVSFEEECYQGSYIIEIAKEFNKIYNKKYLAHFDVEFFKEFSINKILEWQKNSLKKYRVNFDNFFSEKKLRSTGEIEKTFQILKEKRYIYEKDGAQWFKSTACYDDKDRVLIKSDGSYTYLLPDIAYHKNKLDRGFYKLINILGPDHHGYINRLLSAIRVLGYPDGTLKFIILQQINLFRDGEKVKMSKRAGELINLDDLIEEVGVDAARYFFLRRSTSSHLDFDLSLAVKQSQDNPVYYIQYSHARISSILNKINLDNFDINEVNLTLLTHPLEIELLKSFLDFKEVLFSITESLDPHHLTVYAEDLAAKFHCFYTECRVIDEREEIKFARYVLIKSVQYILKIIFNIIGVSAPDKM